MPASRGSGLIERGSDSSSESVGIISSSESVGSGTTKTPPGTMGPFLNAFAARQDKSGFVKEEDTYTKTITSNVGNSILVRGEKVDDFLSIKKNYLWTIATSALQEVDRQLQAEKAKVASLEARILALEKNVGFV